MDRKQFFKKTVQMVLASGSLLLCGRKNFFAQSSTDKPKDSHQKFKEDWIASLMKNLDEQFDEETRLKLMESCGRNCARRGAIRLAESCKGDVEKMVNILAEHLGKENNSIEGNTVKVGYDKCLCELVAEGPERLSDTFCNCSRGWLLEMFETAAGKPVSVELLQSIKRGSSSCRFIVHL